MGCAMGVQYKCSTLGKHFILRFHIHNHLWYTLHVLQITSLQSSILSLYRSNAKSLAMCRNGFAGGFAGGSTSTVCTVCSAVVCVVFAIRV